MTPTSNLLDEVLDESGALKQPDYHSFDINQKGIMNSTFLGLHYLRKQPSGGSISVTTSVGGEQRTPNIPFPMRTDD